MIVYGKPKLYGGFGEDTSAPGEVWKIGPFNDWETAQTAIRLCWGAFGSRERNAKKIGHCCVDFYDRPERWKHARPWPGVVPHG